MKFNIKEGDYLQDCKEEFILLYNNPSIAVNDIHEIMGISRANVRRLRKQCKEEGTIKLRPNRNKSWLEKQKFRPRYYGVNRNGEKVNWTIKKNGIYYGSVHNVRQAEEMVKRLKECNWDKNKADEIREFVIQNY